MAAFERTRQILPDLAEMPEIPWNRLAAEMKANIRLGLAAGRMRARRRAAGCAECRAVRARARAAVALASVAALLVAGLVLERPAPVATAADDGMVVQATANGIQVREGGQALRPDESDGMAPART